MQLRFGIYYKQFLFFIFFLAFCVVSYVLIGRYYVFASLRDEVVLDRSAGTYQLDLEILANGNVKIGDNVYRNLVTPLTDYDQFKYVAYSEEGVYLPELSLVVHLPQAIKETQFHPREYAVHGVGDHQVSLKDSQTIVFQATDLTPTATYTIELELPKDLINFPWYRQVVFGLTQMPFTFWILIGLFPLVITLVILFYVYHKTAISWVVKDVEEMSDLPPDDLIPAEASILLNDKITSRALAATFIDLANRGKIKIVDRDTYLTFSKGVNSFSGIRRFEAILLGKIFKPNQRIVTQEDIDFRIGNHIFSRKIAQVYLELYNNLYSKGYFLKNPALWQGGFRRVGYLMFFVGIIGFILNLLYFSNLSFMLFIWFTIVISATFLVATSPHLSIRTKQGIIKTKEWIKFRNFLASTQTFGYSNNIQEVYENYLPYAVAFGVEKAWTHRFIDYPLNVSKWLITSNKTVVLENIINEVVPFIKYISSKLTQSKEPIV